MGLGAGVGVAAAVGPGVGGGVAAGAGVELRTGAGVVPGTGVFFGAAPARNGGDGLGTGAGEVSAGAGVLVGRPPRPAEPPLDGAGTGGPLLDRGPCAVGRNWSAAKMPTEATNTTITPAT